jgi:ComF family protein
VSKLLDFLLPTPCVICSKLGAPLCTKCLNGFEANFINLSLGGVSGFAISDYTPEAAFLVNNLKEKGVTSLSLSLAKLVSRHWPTELDNAILIPVPSSRGNSKKRGFSHTALLSKALAREIPMVGCREILKSAKPRVDQVGLSPAERVQNMREAFRADLRGFDPRGRALVLVDDVLTSGATMAEAIACLEAAGLEIASFLVFARAGGR